MSNHFRSLIKIPYLHIVFKHSSKNEVEQSFEFDKHERH